MGKCDLKQAKIYKWCGGNNNKKQHNVLFGALCVHSKANTYAATNM
jgi:hypothetical protein